MGLKKDKQIMSPSARKFFGMLLCSGVLAVPSVGDASSLMTRSEMLKQVQMARGKEFTFEATCGVGGMGFLTIGTPHYSDGDPGYPPEMAKCIIFGSQDQARSICLCADLEDPVEEAIGGDKIPSLDEGFHGPDVFEALEDLCTGQFNAVCGPFAESVDVDCENEAGECMIFGHGSQREGGLNVVGSGCECFEGSMWYLEQELKSDIELDVATANGLCEAQLRECQGGSGPVLHDFHTQNADAYSLSQLGCDQDGQGRYDECLVALQDDKDKADFRCDCSGTLLSGEIDVNKDNAASSLHAACKERLVVCEGIEPEEDEDPWPEGEEGPVPEKKDPWPEDDSCESVWEDILDALGCRAVPSNAFGFQSLLGFGAFIMLSARFRRRRGE